ncbi:uncharacterized protein NEMAJ01_2207 [Nematocida major]|uniref:uncharacterized protein n=1 Tax=Nematocida major TaxID=1912982 RepID=UPI0020081318|nr:uncharacterized protein NEMAJ01_2207 [Nematocida major]KAH9387311.1 hypothetical protein NEMAJ01_2207 [Nematocida major]
MGIGQQVLAELNDGSNYYDMLNRNMDELDKIEQQMKEGSLPSIFRLHSKESMLAPKTPEEFMDVLALIDINVAQPKTAKEIVERVMGYPLSYYEVKKRVTDSIRIRSVEYIKKNKKLECSLFKAHVQILNRCTNAYFEGVIKPLIKNGMPSSLSLIISRVIMKSTPDKAYMEEFLGKLMGLTRTHSVYTLITAVLIKNIQFRQETLNAIYEYVLEGLLQPNQRFLAWNKVVLIFVRNYKKHIPHEGILGIYEGTTSAIELEIRKELLTQ